MSHKKIEVFKRTSLDRVKKTIYLKFENNHIKQVNLVYMSLAVYLETLKAAFTELYNNKLRAVLSLLGITVGIVCIISVLSSVDSLEKNMKNSLGSLGSDILYIQKWPWGGSGEYKWWEYLSRPEVTENDMLAIQEDVEGIKDIAFIAGDNSSKLKFRNLETGETTLWGITYGYGAMKDWEYAQGRYFSEQEIVSGRPVGVLGAVLAEELFGNLQAVGQQVSYKGHNFTVIGVLKKEGNNMFNLTADRLAYVPLRFYSKYFNVEGSNPTIAAQLKPHLNKDDIIMEIGNIIRREHKLNPKEKDDFSVNEISMMNNMLSQLFSILNLVGILIGIFSIIVGAFGVANIMFVSVKERTAQIGIKKALGAPRGFILSEFLIESILLCIVGGLLGLSFVYIIFQLVNWAMAQNDVSFKLILSIQNILIGLIISISIGIISGFIPALRASKLKPVEAMRS